MRRAFSILLTLALMLSLCACGGVENTIKNIQDIPDSTMGAMTGTSSADIAARYCRDVRIYDNQDAMFNDLRAGTLDCVLVNSLQDKALRRGQSGVTEFDDLVNTGLCFITAKESADLCQKLSEAIVALQDQKVIRSIIRGYTSGSGRTYEHTVTEADATLTMGVRPTYYPYSYTDGEGQVVGIDVDIAYAVCDYLGVALEIIPVPTSNLTSMVRQGGVSFAAGGFYVGDGMDDLVDHTVGYTEIREQLLVRS